MSKVNRTDHIFCHVDPRFDGLNIIASEDRPRRSRLEPHCDCRRANEIFFGVTIRSAGDVFTMVPVEATRDGFCKHCGYVAPLRSREDLAHAIANRKNSTKALQRIKPVIGTNIYTGEQVEFPTAKDATNAGFGSVAQAIRRGTPLHGWKWERKQ